MVSMDRPLLRKYTRCLFDLNGITYCPQTGEVYELSDAQREARALALNAISAFQRQPVHGPPLVLADGSIVSIDTWAWLLHDTLSEILCARSGALEAMRAFSTEAWLDGVVAARGTEQQKAQFVELVAHLSALDDDESDCALSGMPLDMRDLLLQPLQEVEGYRRFIPTFHEVEVYRDIDDAPQPNQPPQHPHEPDPDQAERAELELPQPPHEDDEAQH